MAEISDKKTRVANFVPKTGVDQSCLRPVVETKEFKTGFLDGRAKIFVNDAIEYAVVKLHRHECIIARGGNAFGLL
jgi:hypothetical protein